jgi:hypothetical protein
MGYVSSIDFERAYSPTICQEYGVYVVRWLAMRRETIRQISGSLVLGAPIGTLRSPRDVRIEAASGYRHDIHEQHAIDCMGVAQKLTACSQRRV